MKKKLLGLALALVLIIGLLPLSAVAAVTDPSPRFYVCDPQNTVDEKFIFGTAATIYVGFENILDTDDTTVLGNKPAKVSAAPAENYIKAEYDGNKKLTITLNSINYKRVGNCANFIKAVNYSKWGTSEYDIDIVLVGQNKIEALSPEPISSKNSPNIALGNVGDVTITGSGSLYANVAVMDRQSFIQHVAVGDLEILNTSITADLYNTDHEDAGTGCIINNGSVTIDNSTFIVNGKGRYGDDTTDWTDAKLYGIRTGTYADLSTDTTKGVTIKNGSNVVLISGPVMPLSTNGPINIENSSVEITKGSSNPTPFATSLPFTNGCTVEMQAIGKEYKPFDSFELAEGTPLTTNDKLIGFKAIHECAAQADDGDCTTAAKCACGKEAIPAKQHTAGANADDCTKDTMCGNEGCTKVFEAATATAHTPAADDGDCTTDILCSNTGCTQVATKGAEKHVWDRANCDVAGACTTPGCTKTVEAGVHTGGTATCKDKAKCDECGAEYGELGACKPAADDGDCTTDIKCSVCGKTTTAGESAHKYTDKNDTTCDNAGCTNTRKVEGTENPKTGDNTAIAVMAALMVTAAAAFVTTKKFAR